MQSVCGVREKRTTMNLSEFLGEETVRMFGMRRLRQFLAKIERSVNANWK